jgi:hypothetical protein
MTDGPRERRSGCTRLAPRSGSIEQPEGFVDLLTSVLRVDANATVGTREAVG